VRSISIEDGYLETGKLKQEKAHLYTAKKKRLLVLKEGKERIKGAVQLGGHQ